MAFFDDAQKLATHSHEMLAQIQMQTEDAVTTEEISILLLANIKHLLEDLRSVLDYSAQGIAERFDVFPNNRNQLQFPYSPPSKDYEWFKREVDRRLPGLHQKCPEVVEKLASYQHFRNRFGNMVSWLPTLMELTNEKKHRELSTHSFKTMVLQEYTVEIPAGAIDYEIPFPPTINSPGNLITQRKRFFIFENNEVEVMMFLKCAVGQVSRIADELSAI